MRKQFETHFNPQRAIRVCATISEFFADTGQDVGLFVGERCVAMHLSEPLLALSQVMFLIGRTKPPFKLKSKMNTRLKFFIRSGDSPRDGFR